MKGLETTFFLILFSSTLGISIKNRIVGGQDAVQGQFPYQVSWCYDDERTGQCINHCAGSIYNDKTIITSAHCCNAVKSQWHNWKIIAGELDLSVSSGFEQIRKIQNYLIHPDFDPSSFNNDICLLTLDSALEWNKNAQRIALDEMEETSTQCLVSGWGAKGNGEQADILQWIEVTVDSDDYCFENIDNFDNETMICAQTPVSKSII